MLNKSGPMLEIGPGQIYIIGPGPMCHIGLAYNRHVCVQDSPKIPSCSIFVRNAHAREMDFPFKEKRLQVVMLGGQIREIDGIIYEREVKDQIGKQKIQRALGGGDFWIWENSFGTCIGGSHPLVNSFISRSDNLYTVLKTIVYDSPIQDSPKIPSCSAFATI